MAKKRIYLFLALLMLQFVLYFPHVGTGFITDDFIWIANTVVDGKVDYLRPFTVTTGFYRPLVNISFGMQYQWHGLNPRPFGLFNLFFHLFNIVLVFMLFSQVEFLRPYALAITVLFAFNAKAVPMALGWISGRTTLMVVFFLLLSLYLFVKAVKSSSFLIYFLSAIAYMAALLCKESAVALPVFLAVIFLLARRMKQLLPVRLVSFLVFLIPMGLYWLLRMNSDAMTPMNAQPFYRYTVDPLVLLKNLFEYITRAGLLDLIILIALALLLLFKRALPLPGVKRSFPPMDWLIIIGVAWFGCNILPMFFLPGRSDLYVYFPQLGLHLVFLTILHHHASQLKKIPWQWPVAVVLLVWSIHLWICINGFASAGKASTTFVQHLNTGITRLQKKFPHAPEKHIVLITATLSPSETGKYPPGRTIGYGFSALVQLSVLPEKKWSGEIIVAAKLGEMLSQRDEKNENIYFTWNRGALTGPYTGSQLRATLEWLCPGCLSYPPGKPPALEKQKKIIEKPSSTPQRPGLLKERKRRLKEKKTTG